jgi:hypothetical protein
LQRTYKSTVCFGLLNIRYAPTATKFRSATNWRYVPIAEARARGGAKFVGYHSELGIAFEKAFHRARSTLLRIS